jgi:uncharacterized protein (DUF58 family)
MTPPTSDAARPHPPTAGSGSLVVGGQRLAAPLPPLLVAAERVAETVWQGVHGRRRIGQGDAFWQFRPYQAGDMPHRIDWKQSAKSDHVYVRQTEWEAAQSVWLWRDASPSMLWRSQRALPHKVERAELLLIALAALLARGGEHMALLDRDAPPATGRPALERLAVSLARRPGSTSGNLPRPASLPRYAQVVLFGDFLASLDQVRAVIGQLTSAGVKGHLVQIVDPAEETLPFTGRVQFAGCEAEGEILFGRAETVRDAYRGRVLAHRGGLAAAASAFGWTFLTHHSDQPPAPALLSLYTQLAEPGR